MSRQTIEQYAAMMDQLIQMVEEVGDERSQRIALAMLMVEIKKMVLELHDVRTILACLPGAGDAFEQAKPQLMTLPKHQGH